MPWGISVLILMASALLRLLFSLINPNRSLGKLGLFAGVRCGLCEIFGVYSVDYVKNRGDYCVDYVKSAIFAHIINE